MTLRSDPATIAVNAERSVAGDLTRIVIHGPLTQQTRDEFKARMLEELVTAQADASSPAFKFRIDFTHCPDIDTTGIGVLVSVAKKIREAGGHVHAAGLNEDLAKLFELTKLDQVIGIERSAVPLARNSP